MLLWQRIQCEQTRSNLCPAGLCNSPCHGNTPRGRIRVGNSCPRIGLYLIILIACVHACVRGGGGVYYQWPTAFIPTMLRWMPYNYWWILTQHDFIQQIQILYIELKFRLSLSLDVFYDILWCQNCANWSHVGNASFMIIILMDHSFSMIMFCRLVTWMFPRTNKINKYGCK